MQRTCCERDVLGHVLRALSGVSQAPHSLRRRSWRAACCVTAVRDHAAIATYHLEIEGLILTRSDPQSVLNPMVKHALFMQILNKVDVLICCAGHFQNYTQFRFDSGILYLCFQNKIHRLYSECFWKKVIDWNPRSLVVELLQLSEKEFIQRSKGKTYYHHNYFCCCYIVLVLLCSGGSLMWWSCRHMRLVTFMFQVERFLDRRELRGFVFVMVWITETSGAHKLVQSFTHKKTDLNQPIEDTSVSTLYQVVPSFVHYWLKMTLWY